MRRTTLLASLVLVAAFASPALSASKVSQQLSQRMPELRFQGVTLNDAIEFLRDVSGTNMTVNWKALEGAGIDRDTPINIHLAGVSLRKAIEMILNDAAGGDVITYFVDQGVIEITTRDIADHNMVTRVYPVEDLLMEIPDFTDAPNFSLDQSQNQGGGGGGQPLGQGGGGGQTQITNQLFANANQIGQNSRNTGKTKAERAQDLVQLIEAVISPDIWKDNGGGTASIRYFNGMLIVTAPRSVQEAIGGEYD